VGLAEEGWDGNEGGWCQGARVGHYLEWCNAY